MSHARHERHSSVDEKTEAQRDVIRQSLAEITAEVDAALLEANLSRAVHIVVPSRHTLMMIANLRDLEPDEWLRVAAIVRQIVGRKLGGEELVGQPLVRSSASVATDSATASREQMPNEAIELSSVE